MAHPSEVAATIVIAVVGVITLTLTVIAVRAQQRTGNPRLWFLVSAFGLFTIKSALVAWAVSMESIAHEHLELVSSLFDLAIVVLLFMPLLRRP